MEEGKEHAANRIGHGAQEEEEHREEYPRMTCDVVSHNMGSDRLCIRRPEDCG